MQSGAVIYNDVEEKPYFSELGSESRKAFMKKKFHEESRFHRNFGKDWCDLDASPYARNMRNGVVRILEQKGISVPDGNLEELHKHISPELKRYGFNDGVNLVSTLLYDTDDQFEDEYIRMIKECVRKHFPYAFLFQTTPTIRVHCPDGENNHHYPRYHTDINYGHPPEEINLWIPLTAPISEQCHGFRIMSLQDSQTVFDMYEYDFAPFIDKAINDKAFNEALNKVSPQVTTPLGKIFAFDSRCIHTAEPMISHTRVSIDIRIVPLEDYRESPVLYQGVGRRKIRYLPGEAYHPKLSTEL